MIPSAELTMPTPTQLCALAIALGMQAGIFTSTASQHGGQETTALTTLPFLAHHGMIYVPIG